MNGRFVAAGAVAGGVIALVMMLAFDPAEGTGSNAYEGGARFGEIFLYVVLGAACGGCVERLRAGASGGLLWGLGALAAAVVVIAMTIDTAGEGTPEARAEDRAKTEFIAGCTDTARANGAPEHAIRPYCQCMYSSIAREGRLEVLASDPPSEPPAWLMRIAQDCASA